MTYSGFMPSLDPKKVTRGVIKAFKVWAVLLVAGLLYLRTIEQTFEFQGKIDDCCCEAELVQDTNVKIYPLLDQLSHTKFFRTFKVNIDSECQFFSVEGYCKYQGCSVCRCDDNNIPALWAKTDPVKQSSSMEYWGSKIGVFETEPTQDWLWRVEEFENNEGSYVDLKENVEAYTGYQGQNIWKLIYEENCFKGEDLCMEQRALNRILSGLHASVSSQLSELYIDFEKNREKMYPNWQLYFTKVGNHPDRIKNLNFYYTVLLRAINRAQNVIRSYNYTTGDPQGDSETVALVNQILDITTLQCDHPFQEEIFFNTSEGRQFKKHYQAYLHNITRIMDCVECEKCKVFGKMQVYGIGVALKILFSDDSSTQVQNLKRNELITLVNAFVKAASSLEVVDKMFYRRYKAHSSAVLATLIGCFFILIFLLIAMKIQSEMGMRIKKMFKNLPSNIPDPEKKRDQMIAMQQEAARKSIFAESATPAAGDKKND